MPQSLSRVIIHLVFATKHRQRVLAQPTRDELHHYLGGILLGIGCQPIRMGGVEDHVHLLFRLSRTITIAKTVEEVKTGSSIWLKTKAPEYAKFHWQNGYAAFSIRESEVKSVTRYIANQEEHHRRGEFQKEYIKLLKENEIEYDERYVWD